jgi:putative membrane protein insertion efficiency factor
LTESPLAFRRARSVPARLLLAALAGYRMTLARKLPMACRYVPSCSEFAAEAVREHGAGRGTWLALRRLLRCHPWGGHGLDPVPAREER